MVPKPILSSIFVLLQCSLATNNNLDAAEVPACSLNGDQDAYTGACVCDKPWSGPDCATLDFLPVSFPQGYGMTPNQTTWGGTIIHEPPKYHLLVSTMTNNCSLRHWTTHSRIEHTISDTITGPYEFQDVVLPTFSHNPKAITLADGMYALFHIGLGTGPDEAGKCDSEGLVTADSRRRRRRRHLEGSGFASAIHIAKSPNGPWVPLVNNTLPGCNNPSPFVHHKENNPNFASGIYIICNESTLLWADNILGPWKILSQIVPNNPNKQGDWYEDPELYIDKRGFHVLFHRYNFQENRQDCTNSSISALMFSDDAKVWHKSPGQPFGNHVELANGDTILVATRERPHLVIGKNPATGQPQLTHLITGTCSATRCPEMENGCVACKNDYWDYTLIQPFRV